MISVFDLFKIGIGPSSSHTVGPMRAGRRFTARLASQGVAASVAALEVRLLGSLAWTGSGHGSDKAVILGLAGAEPDTIDPDEAEALVARIRADRRLDLAGRAIAFDPETAIVFDFEAPTPVHPNTLVMIARDGEERPIA
jgi:L-serine dehydratase